MILSGPGYKLHWCKPVQARMWPFIIVVDTPVLNDLSGVVVTGEEMLVQTLIAQASIEAFHKTVLHGFAGLDIVPIHPTVLAPLENGV